MISLALMSSASYAATPKSLPSNGGTLADTQYSASGTLNGTYTFSAPEVEIESNFSLSNGSAMSSTGTIIFTPGAPDRMQAQAHGSGTQATISAGNIKIKTLPDGQDPNKMWGNGLAASSGATLTVNVTDTLSGDTNGRSVKATGKGSHLIINSKTVHLKNSLIPSNGFFPKSRVADFYASGETIAEMNASEDITLEGGTDVSSTGVMNITAGGNITIGNSVYNVGETNIKAADNASSDSVWTFNNIIANRVTAGKGVTIESKGKEISITNGISVGTGSEHNSNNMLTIKNPNADLFIYGRAHSYKQQKGANGKYVDVLITNDYGLVSQSRSSAELDVQSITINEGLYAFNGHDKVHLKASEDITLKKTSAAAPTLKVKDEKTEVTLEGKKITLTGKEGFNTVEILDSGSSTMIASEKIAIADDTLVKNNAILNITSPVTVIEGGALSVIDNAKVNFTDVAGSTPKLRVTNPRSAQGKTGSDEDPLEALYIKNSQQDFTGVNTTFAVSQDTTYSPDMGTALRLVNHGTLTHDKASWTVYGNAVVDSVSSALTIGKDSTVTEVGDVFATNGGKVDMTLNANSAWEGRADDFLNVATGTERMKELANLSGNAQPTAGQIKLTMAGGTWTARGQSTLSELAFANKGLVDMTKEAASSVHIGKLSGSDGTFKMTLHSDPTKSDMLYVDDAAGASNVNVKVAIVDGDDVTKMEGLRFATTKGNTADGLFKVSSEDQGFNDMKFNVAHESYNQDNSAVNKQYNEGDAKPGNDLVNQVYGDKGTNWYLTSADLTPSTSGKVILATARHNYWQAVDMDRLNKRLGDRRLAGDEDHGLWVRMRHDRLGTNAGVGDFRSRDWTYQVGYDYSWKRDGGQQLFGFALDYKDADTHYRSVTGTGSSDRVGLTAYTTWLGETGWYYDAVARVGRLSNDFTLFNSRGERITGDYHNTVWSLSLEGGKKLTHEATRIYFEPQAQVQFLTVSDADYTTSQETRVHQDRLNSVITRLGFRLGRDFGAQERSTVYVKADWMREWRGRETIRAFDMTTPENGSEVTFKNRGNWFDVGLGVQSPFTENLYGFLDAEYRFGNDLQKSWQFNTGVRWLF